MKLSGQMEPEYTEADVNSDGSFSISIEQKQFPYVFIFADSDNNYLGYLEFKDGEFGSIPTSLVSDETDIIDCGDISIPSDVEEDGTVSSETDIAQLLSIDDLIKDTVAQAGDVAALTAKYSDFDKNGIVDRLENKALKAQIQTNLLKGELGSAGLVQYESADITLFEYKVGMDFIDTEKITSGSLNKWNSTSGDWESLVPAKIVDFYPQSYDDNKFKHNYTAEFSTVDGWDYNRFLHYKAGDKYKIAYDNGNTDAGMEFALPSGDTIKNNFFVIELSAELDEDDVYLKKLSWVIKTTDGTEVDDVSKLFNQDITISIQHIDTSEVYSYGSPTPYEDREHTLTQTDIRWDDIMQISASYRDLYDNHNTTIYRNVAIDDTWDAK